MKLFSIATAAMVASMCLMGCNLKEHMEDIGFKEGKNPVEKATIKYDTLINKDEFCNQMWSDYEANLQRRADLIPMLVETAKGFAAHEHETLEAVISARAAATQIKMTSDDLSDPVKAAAFNEAQSKMKGSLSRLMVVSEKYPELKADKHFHDLMVQMEGTENRILRARTEFNKSVAAYNEELRHVSGKAINPLTGFEFKRREGFKAEESAKVAPKVDFSKPGK